MKRSEINRLQHEALGLFVEYRFSLPPVRAMERGGLAGAPSGRPLLRQQMGWDLTDFGSGRF
jgi:D-lyxose ketol-isomerase